MLTVLIFMVAGFFIRRALKNLSPGYTKQEQKVIKENQQRALRQIEICIATMTTYMLYNETYTLALKVANSGCTNVFPGHKGANNFLWFISRGMTDYFWMYPFLYIFWPKAVKMEVRTVSSASGSHQDIEVITAYDEDDSDDEVESMYPSSARTWSNMRSLVRSYTFSVHQAQPNHSSSPIRTGRPLSSRLDPVAVSSKDYLTSPPTSGDKVGSVNISKDRTTEGSPA